MVKELDLQLSFSFSFIWILDTVDEGQADRKHTGYCEAMRKRKKNSKTIKQININLEPRLFQTQGNSIYNGKNTMGRLATSPCGKAALHTLFFF